MAEHIDSCTPKKRRRGQYMKPAQRKALQQAFLESYVQTANILTSCNELGISRTMIYYWQEHDTEFMLQFNQADAEANLMIEAEIKRRAIDGVVEPVVSAGQLAYEYEPMLDELTGKQKLDSKGKPMWQRGAMITVRKYSDTLLIFLAKKRIPAYRDKSTLDVNTNVKAVEIYKVRMPDNGRD